MGTASTMGRGVVLGGFMGSGKSTVGRALASTLGLPSVDTDRELERRFGPVAEQIRRDGLGAFRARERALLAELDDGCARVIATGGGMFADPAARAGLASLGWLVTLEASLPVLRARVGAGSGRPLWGAEVARLLLERRPHYRQVDLVVDAERSPAAVARDIARWLSVARDVPVAHPVRYDVAIRADLRGLGAAVARACGADRCALLTDSNVGPLWADAATRSLAQAGVRTIGRVVLPAGEEHKTVATWQRAVDGLLEAGISRSDVVVALGGGVLGDIAGFAAASVLRGVRVVQVPTTLLAMVDSSVGGKVAVDHPRGKNLIGTFHHPSLVWAPLGVLGTLAPREVRAGLAEVLKIGLALDGAFALRVAASGAQGSPEALSALVARAVALKAAVVQRDPEERGERAILNLGHTVGHAVERAAGFGRLLHGEAVAIGLVVEARLAERLGLAPAGLAAQVASLVAALGLPTGVPASARDGLAEGLTLDKKRRGAMLRWPVLEAVGRATLHDVPTSRLQTELSRLP